MSKFTLKTYKKNTLEEISNNFSYIFKGILNMINPVIPFVTEKISLELNYISSSLYNEPFLNAEKYSIDEEVENFEKVIELIKKSGLKLKMKSLKVFLYIFTRTKGALDRE